MKTVIAFLNGVLDAKEPHPQMPSDEVRHALAHIERQEMAVVALRQIVEHPKNEEARAHAQRFLTHLDEAAVLNARRLAQESERLAAAKKAESDQEFADLA